MSPRVVDVNCSVNTPDGFPDAMTAVESWLVHDRSRRQDPGETDQLLLSACRPLAPRLRAQMVLLPPATDGHSLERARSAGHDEAACRTVRFCPGRFGHGYPLVDWVLSPLPELCEREDLVIAIDYLEGAVHPPWDEVVRFARAYPRVPMLLLGAAIDANPAAPAALDASANLVYEISNVQDPRALAALVDHFGSHRFVFGSGSTASWEQRVPAAVIDEPDRSAILSGTADALDSGAWGATYL